MATGGGTRLSREIRQAVSGELLARASHLLDAMESLLDAPGSDPARLPVGELFLAARRLKSAVSMAGLDSARRLAHAMEEVLVRARLGMSGGDPDLPRILGEAVGALAGQVEAAVSGQTPDSHEELAREMEGLAPQAAPSGQDGQDLPDRAPSAEDYEAMDREILARLLDDFLSESRERLDQITLLLARLEENVDDTDLVDSIFRIAHTIKGTAAFVGLDGIKETAHRMEDVFGAVRKGELAVTSDMLDTMFRAVDLLAALRAGAMDPDGPQPDIDAVMSELTALLNESASPGRAGGHGPTALKAESAQASPSPGTYVSGRDRETVRVPTRRLDVLMNLVGELITSRNRLNDLAETCKREDLSSVASGISRLASQLHKNLLSVRMVPVGRLFNRFTAVVRNLARERNKRVELVMSGMETELDKNVIERIHDPLVHLLRNAVDHGLEPPEIRLKAGKPEKGRITLASRHRQDNVIIEIGDDGAGIDPGVIRAKAVAKGLVGREEAEAMPSEDVLRLIFTPGFSTAETVSDLSGRGVGLDVVASDIRELRGMVDVRSVPGEGTLFRVRIPLTLAVMQVLLVRVDDLVYALPLSSVMETLVAEPGEIKAMEKSEVVFIRGRAYPLKRLADLLPCPRGHLSVPAKEAVPVVVVGLAEKRVALAVDELLSKQEVVMKSLGEYLGRIKGVEGASVLADGTVTLIVDVSTALGRG